MHDDFEFLMGKKSKHWQHVQNETDVKMIDKFKVIFEKNRKYETVATGEFKIPPTVHFIWLGPRPFPAESVENVRTWIGKNPGWKVKYWTDRERPPPCSSMEVHYVQDFKFLKLEQCYRESDNFGEKSDILRYEILFQEGGVYADHDANCLRPFDSLHRGYDLYACLEVPHVPFAGFHVTAGNGVIGSRASHPVVNEVMDWILNHWNMEKAGLNAQDLVLNRTYIALTHALEKSGQQGNIDIVFPAAYFFAKQGVPSLYSKHFYANAWAQEGPKKSTFEKWENKALTKIEHKTKKAMRLINFVLFFFCLFAVVCVYFGMSKLKSLRKS